MNVAHNHCQIAPINLWVKQKSRVHLLKFLKYLVMSCNIIATLKYKLNAVQFYTKDLLKKLMFKNKKISKEVWNKKLIRKTAHIQQKTTTN